MKIIFLFSIIILFGCTKNDKNSLKLECNGSYYFSSKSDGKIDIPTNTTSNVRLIFDIESNILNEVNFNRFKDVKCTEFTSNKIKCEGHEDQGRTVIRIVFDRLNGEVKSTKTEKSKWFNYIIEEEFEGQCKKIDKRF